MNETTPVSKENISVKETNTTLSPNLKESDGDSVDVLTRILFTLRTLQLQNKKLSNYQEISYRWHLQHHNNLKKIIMSLNHLNKSLESLASKNGQLKKHQALMIEADEDEKLLSSEFQNYDNDCPTQESMKGSAKSRSSVERNYSELQKETYQSPLSSRMEQLESFHDFVISFKDDIFSITLENALLCMNNEQFQQLQGLYN